MTIKILIADDDPVVRHILTSILETRGYTVLTASSGAEGLSLLSSLDSGPAQELPHLIFLDFFLGDMKGTDLLLRIRCTESFNAIPVIVLSANTQEDMRELGADISPDYYMSKPFKPDQVFALVDRALVEGRKF